MFKSKQKGGTILRGFESPPIEVKARKSDTYEKLLSRSTKALKMNPKKGKIISFFRFSGTRVEDKNIIIREKNYPWSLRNYLLSMRKSAGQVKLGVGYITDEKVNIAVHAM